MILGMTTSTFTLLHVLISLVGIGSGLVMMYGVLTANRMDRWTALFVVSTAATSLTGFAFPNAHVTPGIVVGIMSLTMLTIAIVARYALPVEGVWRPVFVVTAALALYFNVFVFIVQSFEKVPSLRTIAPTQKEPPFAIAQLSVLILFVVGTVFGVKRFHPDSKVAGASEAVAKRAA